MSSNRRIKVNIPAPVVPPRASVLLGTLAAVVFAAVLAAVARGWGKSSPTR